MTNVNKQATRSEVEILNLHVRVDVGDLTEQMCL